jgi:phosphoribosylaminoimidazolecarboxamide formyltransferase/IMP cyclohydrolase
MKTALISVYDKNGVLDFARALRDAGWRVASTGGTAATLRKGGVEIVDVAELTGFPECLDGRVKTLHPAVHAGILARRTDIKHMETLKQLGIGTIDLVCVNLYPFFEKVQEHLPDEATIEFIDIGGPSMLRAAAKNYRDVIVVTDTADYAPVLAGLRSGGVDEPTRRRLAGKVFNLTAAYDAAVARYLLADEEFPAFWPASLRRKETLRYGENSHQKAALYLQADGNGALGSMKMLGGKELSYNNIRDLDVAWKTVCAFGLPADGTAPVGSEEVARLLPTVASEDAPCVVAVKHNTPCGLATGATIEEAYAKTYLCDPVSIFGGIVACNRPVTVALAERLGALFLEIVVAPAYEPAALEVLRRKKNLRIMLAPAAPKDTLETISVDGGLLAQEPNRRLLDKWEVVTKAQPDATLVPDMLFGMRAVTWVKSNGIAVVKDQALVGAGGGQTNRIWPTESALKRAGETVATARDKVAQSKAGPLPATFTDGAPARVMASDAFFPFPDVVEAAANAGITTIIQPGGSNNDPASIAAADKAGIAMVFTGLRLFKH